MRTYVIVAALMLSGNCVVTAAQDRSVQERLNPKIRAPIRGKYAAIRDARDWLNPIITIRAEGIEVTSKAIPAGRQTVVAGKLRALLVSLPVGAWPYGRVVVASDIGIREPDRGDDELIKRNHDAGAKILRALAVEVDWWPSA